MANKAKELSTSALAKKLGKTSKQMFSELEALGWIRRTDDHWELTTKGEFEQGSYRTSDKYGTYIVWPVEVEKHKALINPDDQLTSAKGLALKIGTSAPKVNRLLVDLGWISQQLKGWQVTVQGKAVGGQQQEDEKSGIPYAVWPKTIVKHPAFSRSIRLAISRMGSVETQVGCPAMDGHLLRSEAEVMIDNWLYLAGIAHACRKPLPVEEGLLADFFIPVANLYIEYWGADSEPGYLAKKMQKKELYQKHQLNVLELQEDDLEQLDQVLPKRLLKYGVDC